MPQRSTLPCHLQLVGKLMAGATLPIPPRSELPGPGSSNWAGLDAYLALLHACTARAAAERPALEHVCTQLQALRETCA